MGELQVALALAVSMLIFSTFVSAIVELIHRTLTLRKHGMKVLIEAFYEKEVLGRLKSFVPADARDKDNPNKEYRGRFLFQMWAGTDSTEPKASDYSKVRRKKIGSKLSIPLPMLDGSVDSMDVDDFFRRLAGTDVGKELSKSASAEVDALIEDLATRFEDYGKLATKYFRRRSQVISVLVAVLFAVLMNVNVVNLVREFYSNETLAQSIIDEADAAAANYQAQMAAIQAASGGGETSTATLEEIKSGIENLNGDIQAAKELGLPIGWSDNIFFNKSDIIGFLAASSENGVTSSDIDGAETPKSVSPTGDNPWWATLFSTITTPDFWAWFLTSVATGLLIGLGGPFWYDMVKRLSTVNQFASAVASRTKTDEVGETKPVTKEEESKAAAKDAFNTATRAATIVAIADRTISPNWKGPKALRL